MTARSDMQPASPRAASEARAPEAEGADAEPPQRSALLSVDVVMEAEDWPGFGDPQAAVLTAARALATHPDLLRHPCDAAVALSSDQEVARLNGAYRQKPTPTNVLSFPAAVPPHGAHPGEPTALGDIILARETILREASESGTPPVHHLQHLVIHGLLHLLGFDHIDAAGAERMEGLETAILARMGLPDPYAGTELEEAAGQAP